MATKRNFPGLSLQEEDRQNPSFVHGVHRYRHSQHIGIHHRFHARKSNIVLPMNPSDREPIWRFPNQIPLEGRSPEVGMLIWQLWN